MPTIDFTDEELQGLVVLLANASGPGINWASTNAYLTKLQQAAQAHAAIAQQGAAKRPRHVPPGDGLDLEPLRESRDG